MIHVIGGHASHVTNKGKQFPFFVCTILVLLLSLCMFINF